MQPWLAQVRRVGPAAFVFLSAWAAAWLVLTAELFMVLNSSPNLTVPWTTVAIGQAIRVLLWMPTTFLVIWAFRSWPLRGPRALASCLQHLALSIVLMLCIHVLRVMAVTAIYWGGDLDHFRLTVFTTFNGLRVTDISLYWAIVGILALKAYSQREELLETDQAQLRLSLAEAELRALKYQLKPHFVYNSLNAIAALIREEQSAKAVDTLADLSVLMRTMSDAPASERTTLASELDFIRRLLAIEQVRFGAKLQVTMDVPPEAENALVPSLLLQPLVENAIKHGISRRVRPGRVIVRVRVVDAGTRLRLQVVNDGPRPSHASAATGVGLSATHERLRLLYGKEFNLTFDLQREEDASVTIDIPFQPATANEPLLLPSRHVSLQSSDR